MIMGFFAAGAMGVAHLPPPALDPSATSGTIDLSGANRIATGNANSGGISKGLAPKSSGKWYIEAVLASFSSAGTNGAGIIGLSTAGQSLSEWLGQAIGTCGLWRAGANETRYLSGTMASIGPAGSIPRVIGLAWDANAGRVWFRRDGTWLSGEPEDGTGATYDDATLQGAHYFAVCPRNTGNQVIVQEAPLASIPSGFSYWTS